MVWFSEFADLGLRALSLGFKVQSSGFLVYGLGFSRRVIVQILDSWVVKHKHICGFLYWGLCVGVPLLKAIISRNHNYECEALT